MQQRPLKIGTRGSLLARTQSGMVAQQLLEAGIPCELIEVSTQADRSTAPIASLGGQGVFTKEIQEALLRGDVDLAVHSLKDLPTQATPGLALVATPRRASVADVLVTRDGCSWRDLPPGARIGTGSLRRRAQLGALRGDWNLRDVRGNVDTRLAKLRAGEFDAIVLAAAGLERLGRISEATEWLPTDLMLPAVGQGALGLEARLGDETALHAALKLQHPATYAAVTAERALLATLQGGCLAPVAAWARQETPDGPITLTARVLHPSGTPNLREEASADIRQARELGIQIANALLAQGAADLIQASRHPQQN